MLSKEITLNTRIGILGEITAEFYDQRNLSPRQLALNLQLKEKLNAGIISGEEFLQQYLLGKKQREDRHKNVVCDAGFSTITEFMTNHDTTLLGPINKALWGTGVVNGTNPAASATDTKLINEVYRNSVLTGSAKDNVMSFTVMLSETEYQPATLTEFGNCVGGTDTANTGYLWTHLTGLNWVKADLVALVVSCKYTFASI